MADQRTEEWLQERCGRWTGSRFADLFARSARDGKPLKAYHDLIWQIAVERLSGHPVEGPGGLALQWGTEVEPFAREAVELATGYVVTECGFVVHPDIETVGASPDGLIGDDGGLELKCPRSSAVHLERYLSGVPDEYRAQIQGCMWVTGRQWWLFASYDPRMPESHRLLTIKVPRDDDYIASLERAVITAEREVCDLLARLRRAAA